MVLSSCPKCQSLFLMPFFRCCCPDIHQLSPSMSHPIMSARWPRTYSATVQSFSIWAGGSVWRAGGPGFSLWGLLQLHSHLSWLDTVLFRLFVFNLSCVCVHRIHFMVIHSNVLAVISQIVGWIYFLLWSLSFYPQAWENWRRKRCLSLCPLGLRHFAPPPVCGLQITLFTI